MLDSIENARVKQVQFSTVHTLIDRILAKIPLAPPQLVQQIGNGFPNRTGPAELHYDYVDNILKLAGAKTQRKLQNNFH